MSKGLNLSPMMLDALGRIRQQGGTIKYYPGGFWTMPAYELGERFIWSCPHATVKALAKRGLLAPAARHPRHNFYSEYRLVD